MATARLPKLIENDQLKDSLEELQGLLGDDTFTGEALIPGLDSLYNELGVTDGAEAQVFVSMEDGDGKGNSVGIWKGEPDDYNLETLAKKFGSGAYRVRVYVKTPGGPKAMRANKVFHWKLSPEDEAKRLAPPQSQQPQADIAKTIVEALAPILSAMQRPAAPAMDLTQMIQIVKMMQPAPQPQLNPMEMLKLGVEMSRSNQSQEPSSREPGSNTNDLIIAMIENFGAPIANAVTQAQQRQMAQQPQQNGNEQQLLPAVVNDAPVSYDATMAQQTSEGEMDLGFIAMQKLKMGLSFLVDQAKAGNPTATYADMLIDNLSTEDIDTILAQPDPIAWITTINGDVANYQAWFKELLDEVKKLMSDSPEEPTT